MPTVLTAAASATCTHGAPLVIVPSQTKLTIGGQPVLVQGDLDTATIPGCGWVPPPQVNIPCTKVVSVSQGASSKFSVGGKPVMLDTATGSTAGKPGPFTFSVQSAGQTKFTSA